MANYVTKVDLSNYSKVVLGLLSQRDTKIADIQDQLDLLGTGLAYKGTTTTMPTTYKDGWLFYFNIPATSTESAMVGWYFWSKTDNAWKQLGGGTDANAVHYKGVTTVIPTNPSNGDMYNFNVPATGTTSAIVGVRLYDSATTSWISLGGVDSGDFTTTNIDFTTEIDQ